MELPEVIFDPDRMTLEEHGREVVRVFEWPSPPQGVEITKAGSARTLVVTQRPLFGVLFLCAAGLWAVAGLVAHWQFLLLAVAFIAEGVKLGWGTVSIRSEWGTVTVSEGIGSAQKHSPFALKDLRVIRHKSRGGRKSRGSLLLQADRTIEFGSRLLSDQRHYVIGFLLDEARRAE